MDGITAFEPLARSPRRLDGWRELALAALALAELSWAVPWLRLLISTERADVSLLRTLLVFGGIYLGAYLLGRLGERLPLAGPAWRSLFGLFLLGSLLIGLKELLYFGPERRLIEFFSLPSRLNQASRETILVLPLEFFLVPALLVGALRGARLAQKDLLGSSNLAAGAFKWGLALYLAYGLVVAAAPRMGELAYSVQLAISPGILLPVFFLASLLALIAARISGVNRFKSGHAIPFDPQRVAGVLLSVLICGGLALLAGWVVLSRWIAALAGAAYRLLIHLVALLAGPLVWLLMQVYTGALEWASQGAALPTQRVLPTAPSVESYTPSEAQGLVQTSLCTSPLILIAAILLGVLAVLVVSRAWASGRRAAAARPVQVSLSLPGNLIERMLAGLVGGLQSLGNRRLPGAERRRAAARIRRIYGNLLDLSAALGCPRQVSQTPLEFLPALYVLFPSQPAEVETITHAYLRVRYGELPETQREVRAVETAWRRLARAAQAPRLAGGMSPPF